MSIVRKGGKEWTFPSRRHATPFTTVRGRHTFSRSLLHQLLDSPSTPFDHGPLWLKLAELLSGYTLLSADSNYLPVFDGINPLETFVHRIFSLSKDLTLLRNSHNPRSMTVRQSKM